MSQFPSRDQRRISQADRRALARIRLRDAADGFCGINHATRMAELAGLTPAEIESELHGSDRTQAKRGDQSNRQRTFNSDSVTGTSGSDSPSH